MPDDLWPERDPGPAPPPGRSPLQVRLRRALAVIVAVALLAVAGVGGFLLFLNQTASSNITQAALLPTPSPGDAAAASGDDPAVSGAGTNILLIGSDARPGDTASRADVIVLVHIPANAAKVYLVHFPRDLYVPIPGYGSNKINAAYAFGGAPLLVRTLQNMLDIRIDHIAKTDFTGFQRMTDAVGGVRVYAEEASNGTGNGGPVVIHKGWNTLNGEQALAFVRERYQLSEGDISRGRRQMAFVKALLLKATSRSTLTNPLTIAAFVDAATKGLVVDKTFSMSVMRGYALSLRAIRSKDVVFVTAPFTGFGTVSGVGSIDVVDDPGMEDLGTLLRTDAMNEYSDVSVLP